MKSLFQRFLSYFIFYFIFSETRPKKIILEHLTDQKLSQSGVVWLNWVAKNFSHSSIPLVRWRKSEREWKNQKNMKNPNALNFVARSYRIFPVVREAPCLTSYDTFWFIFIIIMHNFMKIAQNRPFKSHRQIKKCPNLVYLGWIGLHDFLLHSPIPLGS